MAGSVIGEKTDLISPIKYVHAYVHSINWMEHYSMRMIMGSHSTVPQNKEKFRCNFVCGGKLCEQKVHKSRGGL